MLVHVQGLHQAGRMKPGRNQDGNLGKAIPKRGLWARASILTHHGRSSWSSITGLDQEPARRQESVGMLSASTRTEGRNQDETRPEKGSAGAILSCPGACQSTPSCVLRNCFFHTISVRKIPFHTSISGFTLHQAGNLEFHTSEVYKSE